jgi:mRNA interferase MazF
MVTNEYTPNRGDIIWLDFNPQKGKEQMGRRPAIVLSPRAYNEKVGLVLVCPITSQIKGYPFEVKLPITCTIKGVIISDQIKSLDWRLRNAEFAESLDDVVINEVINKVSVLLK